MCYNYRGVEQIGDFGSVTVAKAVPSTEPIGVRSTEPIGAVHLDEPVKDQARQRQGTIHLTHTRQDSKQVRLKRIEMRRKEEVS